MYHLTTLAFLILALFFYAAGSISGALILFVLGLLCEVIFWLRLFKKGCGQKSLVRVNGDRQ
jgi:hypothetical protein